MFKFSINGYCNFAPLKVKWDMVTFCELIGLLDGIDRSVMLALNFDGGSVLDGLAVVFSSRLAWVPWALLTPLCVFRGFCPFKWVGRGRGLTS